jgi:uncharacterized protein YkwD
MPEALKIGRARAVLLLLLVVSAAPAPLSKRVLAFSGGGSDDKSRSQATLKPASASVPDIPFIEYDSQTEGQLLELANQARAEAGAPSLTLDSGLTQAARTHAEAMFAARQLSHRFADEPSLAERLAACTRAQLDQEAENVALDYDAAGAQQHLMLSPPHRANLLNPAYNLVGLGVIRSGDRLYIVQDFGRALPNYSVTKVKAKIVLAVAQARQTAHQPGLPARDLANADDAACSMAQADKLGTPPVNQLAQRYTVLAYTTLHPETLPGSAGEALSSHNLRSFSVGACYARTEKYPTGVYWVVLLMD